MSGRVHDEMPVGEARCRRNHAGGLGQSTVEYAMVLFAFLASIVVLDRVLDWARSGGLLQGAMEGASHLAGQGLVGALQDALLY